MNVDVYKTSDKRCISKVEFDENNKEVVDYDQLLTAAGEFGPYQLFLFFATFPFYVFGVFSYFSQMFITETSSNHWCWIPELANMTELERRNLAIPPDNSPYGYQRCQSYYAVNWSEVLATGIKPNETWPTIACQNGWEFNKTEIPYPTISSEMGWVCDKASYQATAQSLFFVGSIIGGFGVGWVADRFGRLPAAVFSNMIGCIAGAVTIFSENFVQFAIYRFFMGMSYDNCMMMTYLLVLEYTAPKYRTLLTNLAFAVFFTLGATTLPWIALGSRHWKVLALATSLPMALSLVAPLLMPESPRWLLSKGRVDDAVQKIYKIAKVNKKEVSAKLIDKFKSDASNNKQEEKNLLDVLKQPFLRRIVLCICFTFTCCMIVYDSLIRTLGQLQFDFFISFSLVSFTELPSLILLSFVMDRIGRRCMILVTMITCGIFSFTIPAVPAGIPSVICAVVARFAINMACNTCMQWAAELLPTSVRGSGTSLVHICGYIGTVISPFVAYLDIYAYWLPMVIVGTLSILAALIGASLPETAGRDMPQSFEAAEAMFKNQKIFELPCLSNNKVDSSKTHVNQAFEMN